MHMEGGSQNPGLASLLSPEQYGPVHMEDEPPKCKIYMPYSCLYLVVIPCRRPDYNLRYVCVKKPSLAVSAVERTK